MDTGGRPRIVTRLVTASSDSDGGAAAPWSLRSLSRSPTTVESSPEASDG